MSEVTRTVQTANAEALRDEIAAGANTRLRVYNLLKDLIDSSLNTVDQAYAAFIGAVAGTDIYTATLSPAVTTYSDKAFILKFTNANTGAATLNLNGVGAQAIKKNGTEALVANDIKAGQLLLIVYDGTNFQIIGGGSGGGALNLEDVLTEGNDGGGLLVKNIGNPVDPQDAATKTYTDALFAQLDAAVILKGSWDASAGTFPGGGVAQAGWSYIVSVAGTVDGVAFNQNDRIIAIANNASTTVYSPNWFKADYTDQFLSLDAQTGATTLGSVINSLTAKTTPVDADFVPINDSAAGNASKKLSWANIKATLKTYFDAIYNSIAGYQSGSSLYAVASGTNTYTVGLTPALTAYTTGMRVFILFTNAQTTAATLNIDGLGAKSILKRNSTALVSGDIAAGQIYQLVYDGTNFRLMGVANTAVLNDILLTNQAAASTKKNPTYVDDTGKVFKKSWSELDTTNLNETTTGVDDLEATTLEEWKNASAVSIMKILNGLKVQFGGTSPFFEVPAGIMDGNSGILFLTAQDIAFRFKDGSSFDYVKLKSSTTTYGRATIISQKQVNDYAIGFETIRTQFKLVLPNTTAGVTHIVGSIAVASGFALAVYVTKTLAYATNGNLQTCEPFSAIGQNVGGTTSGVSTTPTALRQTATTGGFTVAWNDSTDTADISFTNETGTGRQYDVVVDVEYITYPIPV